MHLLDPTLARIAREEARKLQRRVYAERHQIWRTPPSPLEMIDPSVVAERLLGVSYLEPEQIEDDFTGHPAEQMVQIGGYIDRRRGVIAVARRFRLEVRRFTGAHEIAHWQLHPGTVYFRDMPLRGGERSDSPEELQANVFAGEFLMPEKLLREEFRLRFGVDCLDHLKIEDIAFRLSMGTPKRLRATDLAKKGRRFRSKLAATCLPIDGRKPLLSLSKLFRVSTMAMAIQLEKLEVV